MDFATELRTRTRREHAGSNAVVHLTAPLALSSRTVYAGVLTAFYHVFRSLEAELEARQAAVPALQVVSHPALRRARAFERDLAFYRGPRWRAALGAPSAATVAYLERLTSVCRADPLLLLAYAQTMYMGLLAGGRIVRGWLQSAMGLQGDEGLAIFDFAELGDVKAFRKRFSEGLNALQLTREEKERVIAEKKKVFEMNNRILKEAAQSALYKRQVIFMIARIVLLVVLLFLILRYLTRPFLWAVNYISLDFLGGCKASIPS